VIAGDVDIFPAIVVIVADRDAVSPAAKIQPRFRGYIGKRAVVIVVIELRRMALAGFVIFDGRAVYKKDVEPAVVVVVECGSASALRFDDVQLFTAATEVSGKSMPAARVTSAKRGCVDGGVSLPAWPRSISVRARSVFASLGPKPVGMPSQERATSRATAIVRRRTLIITDPALWPCPPWVVATS